VAVYNVSVGQRKRPLDVPLKFSTQVSSFSGLELFVDSNFNAYSSGAPPPVEETVKVALYMPNVEEAAIEIRALS
jgi:hypothetical protein